MGFWRRMGRGLTGQAAEDSVDYRPIRSFRMRDGKTEAQGGGHPGRQQPPVLFPGSPAREEQATGATAPGCGSEWRLSPAAQQSRAGQHGGRWGGRLRPREPSV